MTVPPTAHLGKSLGRYRILRELGRGGMGVVYLAHDERTGRQVALKTTSVANLGAAEKSRGQRRHRFVREVQALTQLNHPNVVHVFDSGEADDPDLGWLLYYTMEYVEGETLAELVQRMGPLVPGAAAAVVMQAARGLGAAHAAGIVHRDVKPANIFIATDGRALVGDFGICKIEGQTQITRRDQVVGTPNYLAPEQILGDPVSPAADVFALAAMFYIVTANRPLRSQTDATGLMRSAQSNEPKERMLALTAVPEGLRLVMARCLERDPHARIPSGVILAEALVAHATSIPQPGPARAALAVEELDDDGPEQVAGEQVEAPAEPVGMDTFANPDDVEAAARAMLAEVSQRKGSKDEPEGLEDAPGAMLELGEEPLLVAKTESTAMFNMRELEEQERARKQAAGAGGPAASAAPVATGGEDPYTAQPTVQVARVGQRSGASAQAPAPRVSWSERVAQVPRPARLGLSALSGAALGVVAMFLTEPASGTQTSEPEAPVAVEVLLDRPRPALCPTSIDVHLASMADRDKAAQLLLQARGIEGQGGQTSEILNLIESARKSNPRDPEIYFELARMLVKDARMAEAEQAYDCVCFASRAHPKCERVLKMREREAEGQAP